jgi:hypothetical protein
MVIAGRKAQRLVDVSFGFSASTNKVLREPDESKSPSQVSAPLLRFETFGELLRRPAMNLGPAVLALDGDPRWRPEFAAVSDYLRSGGAELPYMPGSARRAVRYSLDLIEGTGNAPRVIRGVRIGEQSALADPLPSGSNRSFSSLFGRSTGEECSGQELRALMAREYLIPIELLSNMTGGA